MVSTGEIASRLGTQSALLMLGYVFTLVIGFPLQIFVVRELGATQLGIFSLMDGATGLVANLTALGIAPTLVRFIPAYLARGKFTHVRQLIRWGIIRLLIISTLALLGSLAVLPLLAVRKAGFSTHLVSAVVMSLLIPATAISFFLQQGLRSFQEIRYMVFGSSFLQLSVKAVLAVLLLSTGLQLLGFVTAVVLSTLAAAGWMALGMHRKLSELPRDQTPEDTSVQVEWKAYARVMFMASLLGIGSAYLDRFVLAWTNGAAAVGVLAIVKQVQLYPALFFQMLLSVAAPMLAGAHARSDSVGVQHIFHLTTDWAVRFSLPLILFLWIFAEPVLALFGTAFAVTGVWALRILLIGQMLSIAFGPVGQTLYVTGHEKAVVHVIAWQTLLMAVGFLILAPMLGLLGLCIVISFGTIFINGATFVIARRELDLRWFNRRYISWAPPITICVTLALAIRAWFPAAMGVLGLMATLGLLYLLSLFISLIFFLHPDDRELLRALRTRLSIS